MESADKSVHGFVLLCFVSLVHFSSLMTTRNDSA